MYQTLAVYLISSRGHALGSQRKRGKKLHEMAMMGHYDPSPWNALPDWARDRLGTNFASVLYHERHDNGCARSGLP
jgi:hypothetical protein